MRLVIAVLLVAVGATASDVPTPAVQPPIILRLDGQFAPDRDSARKVGFDAVSLGIGERNRWFGVREARTVGAQHSILGRDVLAAVAPLQPNLKVSGPPALRGLLAEAPFGTPLRIEGLVRPASGALLLRDVSIGEPRT